MTPAEAKKLYGDAIMDIEQFRESVKQSLKHVTDDTKTREPGAYERLSGWCNPTESGEYTVSRDVYTQMQMESYTRTQDITARRTDADVAYLQQMDYIMRNRASLNTLPTPLSQVELEDELEPEPKLGVTQYNSGHYSEYLFNDTKRIVGQYVNAVETSLIPEHDTLISTGLSGSIAAGLFAHATNKMYAVLRKEGAKHHSSNNVEGRIGAKWIFVDDFIGGGHTRRRVHDAIDELVVRRMLRTTYVGSWLYLRVEYEKER